jgi:hypothetical protein
MSAEKWTEREVGELLPYLSEAEQRTMQMLVHFARKARSSPGSSWGPVGSFGFGDTLPPEDGPMQTSAEFVADLDQQMGELLRAAVLRKGRAN